MSDIDLTEAARAIRAAQASRADDQARLAKWWDEGLTSPEDVEIATRQARAALPHIERLVREQVTREIEAMFVHSTVPGEAEVIREVKAEAARIARGDN